MKLKLFRSIKPNQLLPEKLKPQEYESSNQKILCIGAWKKKVDVFFSSEVSEDMIGLSTDLKCLIRSLLHLLRQIPGRILK